MASTARAQQLLLLPAQSVHLPSGSSSASSSSGRGDSHASMPGSRLVPQTSAVVVVASARRHRFSSARLDRYQNLSTRSGPFFMALAGPGMSGGSGSSAMGGGIQGVYGSKWGKSCGSSAFQRRELSQWATRKGLWQIELLGIGAKEMCGFHQQPCVAAGLGSSNSSKRAISFATPHSSLRLQQGVEPHSHASENCMGRLRGNAFAPSECHRPLLRASVAANASGAAVAGGGGSSSSSSISSRGNALSGVRGEGSSSVRGGGGPRSGAEQWVAKVLEEAPCRVPEQMVLPDGRVVVTVEEKEEVGIVSGVGRGDWADRLSAWIRRFGEGEDSATRDLSASSLSSASMSAIGEGKERSGSSSTQAAGTIGGRSGSTSAVGATDVVRLKDLLRKHKGQLFVPEEALSRTAAAAAAAGLPAPTIAETRANAAAAAEEAAESAEDVEEMEEAAGKVRDASDTSRRRKEAGKDVGVGSGFAVSNCSREVFDQLLRQSPQMSVSEFERHVSGSHVEVLTSRAVRTPGGTVAPKGATAGTGFDYFDVLVTLKPPLQQQQLRGRKKQRKQAGEEVLVLGAEGEPSRLNRTWVLRFTEEEEAVAMAAGYHSAAERLLRQYKGRQEEVEDTTATLITASVGAAPPAAPLPAASTISGRLVLELSVLTALAHSMLSAVAAVASSLVLGVVGVAAAAATRVAWPLVKSVLGPPAGASLALLQWLASALTQLWVGQVVPAATSAAASWYSWLASLAQGAAAGGSQGLMGLDALAVGGFDEASRALLLEKVKSGTKSVAVMFFVLLFMAAGAKFTLNRRTRDFKKWDIWQAIEFGQSKPQARVEGSTGVKFSDVAGIDNVVQELQELVEYLKDPERFSMMGTKPPHGVLMEGPPGCGKTLMAKAIAGEAGVPFYQMAGSEFVEVLVGVGAARIRDLFKRAKVNKPAVVFIDEIDALGAVRAAAGADDDDGGVTERETTLNQLLIELDGFDTGQGVVFLAATNRMDLLDPALLRPGRFDRKITIAPAGSQGRLEILKVHSSRVKMNPHVDLHAVANNLAGWSGARLANLLQEAALVSVRRGGTQIEDEDLAAAADRLTLGAPTARQLAEQQLRPQLVERMAVHEAGLALTAALLRRSAGGSAFGEVEPPQRISIIPRSTASSWTVFSRLDDEAYALASHQSLLNRLQVFLGGRVAEELVWGRDSSTYSTRYAADASWMAYKLVSIWHVGTRMLGAKGVMARGVRPPWARPAEPAGPVLDFEGHLYSDYGLVDSRISDHADATIAALTRNLLDEATAATWQLLDSHKEALEDIVEVLLHKGEVDMEVIDGIVNRHTGVRDPSALKKCNDTAVLQRIDEDTVGAETAVPSLEAAASTTNGYHGALGPAGAGAAGHEQQSSAAKDNPARTGRVCFGRTDGDGQTAPIGKVGEVIFGSLSAHPSSLTKTDAAMQPSEWEAEECGSSSPSVSSGTPAVAVVAASALSSPSGSITPDSDVQLPLEEGALPSAASRGREGEEEKSDGRIGSPEAEQKVAEATAASADAGVGAAAFVNGHVGHDGSMDGRGDAEHVSDFGISKDADSKTGVPPQSRGGRDGEGGQSEREGGGQEVEDPSVNVLHSA